MATGSSETECFDRSKETFTENRIRRLREKNAMLLKAMAQSDAALAAIEKYPGIIELFVELREI